MVSAEIYAFGAFFFAVYGSGAPQWWAEGVVTAADPPSIQVLYVHAPGSFILVLSLTMDIAPCQDMLFC